MVDKDAPVEFKRRSHHAYHRTFGAGGIFEQDDVQAWSGVTRASKGVLARKMPLNFRLGFGASGVEKDFPGPGRVHVTGVTERSQYNFYCRWHDYLTNKL